MKLLNLLLLSAFICVTSVAQKSLPAIKSQAQFDAMSETYYANTPYALPHIMFVIDRQNGNRIYYVNKKRYAFHKDFINGTYLSLESGREASYSGLVSIAWRATFTFTSCSDQLTLSIHSGESRTCLPGNHLRVSMTT